MGQVLENIKGFKHEVRIQKNNIKVCLIFALTTIISFLMMGCGSHNQESTNKTAVTTQTDQVSGKYKLVWADEFNEKTLDTASWNYEVNGNGGGNNELQYYTDSPQNLYLKDGHLYIVARKESYKGKSYTSARINTKGKESWRYGKFEMRAKLPTGRGTWPAFWLLGQNITSVGWPACGEIDIMENVGFDPLWIHGSIHTPSSHGNTVNHGKIKIPDCSSEYHIYGMIWTPEKISFYVDDSSKPYYTYDPTVKNDSTWPFNQPMFIILNDAIGGGWGGQKGVDNSIFPVTYDVDYVRVYQLE